MTTRKCTDGPYEIKIGLWGHKGEHSIWGAKNSEGAQPLVCIIHQQNEKADAPLLAASYELLMSLEECRNAMHSDNPADGWYEIIKRADAAIAKAKG